MGQDFVSEGTLESSTTTRWHKHPGGKLAVSLQDEFGGGTATLQASYDDGATIGPVTDIVSGNTISVAAGTDNTPYLAVLELPACWLRWSLATATNPNLQWKFEKSC